MTAPRASGRAPFPSCPDLIRHYSTEVFHMNGKRTLYRDQYGNTIFANTVRELREKAGGGRVSKIYRDKRDGSAVHCGYVVGRLWFSAFMPFEKEA